MARVLPSKRSPCSVPSVPPSASPSSPRCVFSLFSPPSVVSLPLFDFQRSLFTIPSPNYKDVNFSQNHFSFFLHTRMFSVHLRFVGTPVKTFSATEPFLFLVPIGCPYPAFVWPELPVEFQKSSRPCPTLSSEIHAEFEGSWNLTVRGTQASPSWSHFLRAHLVLTTPPSCSAAAQCICICFCPRSVSCDKVFRGLV